MSTEQGQFYLSPCGNRTGIFDSALAFLVWRVLAFEVRSHTPASYLSLWTFHLALSGNSTILCRQTILNILVLWLSRKVREHLLFQFQYPLLNDSYWAEHDLWDGMFQRDYKSPGLHHMWGFKNWCPSCWDLPPPPPINSLVHRCPGWGLSICMHMAICVHACVCVPWAQPQPWTFSSIVILIIFSLHGFTMYFLPQTITELWVISVLHMTPHPYDFQGALRFCISREMC